MSTHDDLHSWPGRRLVGADGRAIGKIADLYADDETGGPTWATVHTGLFGHRTSFVPLSDARLQDDDVLVPVDKAQVQGAPNIDPEGHLTPVEEDELYRYYGRPDSRGPSRPSAAPADGPSAARADGPPAAPAARPAADAGTVAPTRRGDSTGPADGLAPATTGGADDAMTLSEEQLRVGTQELPATKVRMRKVTITENVQMTVPVTREEVRLEEVPLDAPDDPDVVPDGEVTLRSEVPVVEKATVDTERVRLGKERVEGEARITEPVRREEIELEDTRPTDR